VNIEEEVGERGFRTWLDFRVQEVGGTSDKSTVFFWENR